MPADNAYHRNLMIVANAGSGKTHCLVTRCIQLLQRDAKPEEILALTFTRAAAAEFLQKLFERLSQAASDPKELAELQKQIGQDCKSIDAEGCTALLRALVQALPRLSMGTLDQYFGRIVRAFPFELGLSKDVELLDDADKEEVQRRTLDRLFSEAAEKKELDEFIETLRQQSRSRADQSALRNISGAASSLQEKFIETPKERSWGRADAIWPEGCPILAADDIALAAAKFRDEVEATNQLDAHAQAVLDGWLELAVTHRPPRRMSKGLKDFLAKLTDGGLGKKQKDHPYVPIAGGQTDSKCLFLVGRVRELRDNLHRSILKLELQSRTRSSEALYKLLADYEELYKRTVRQAGQLTFTDLATLLALHQKQITHQHIEYRLDGRYSHWLLDEFQDTSRLQWRIMLPLVDNVVCEDEGRSFFYVGDTKQAIYGWRGGDFELFDQVHEHFRTNRGVEITRKDLPLSWRSDENIVKVINEVFAADQLEKASDFKLPDEMVANWRRAWVKHEEREEVRGKGFAQLRTLEFDRDDGAEGGQAALDQAVLDIIRDVDPVKRGINCAIIVRTRAKLSHYVALLRGQKDAIPVAAEGRVNPCLKSPEGLALFALVKFLASPIDRIAEEQFLASPFGVLAENDSAAFHTKALGLIAAAGLAATLSDWVREAVRRSLVDATKVEAFIEAASDYDAQKKPGEDLRAFVEFIDHRVEQESETPGVVRVMTTHFSKGLGMDMVILPELDGKGLSEFRDTAGIAVHRDKQGDVQWGLSLPSQEICAADPTLGAAREHLRARQAYENLCLLYVAITRAKHALYCLRAPTRDLKNTGRWLNDFFPRGDGEDPDNRTLGDPKWFEAYQPKQLKAVDIKGGKIHQTKRQAQDSAPSLHEDEDVPAGLILGGGAARHLGTEVHELLAQVEWLGKEPDFSGATQEAAKLVREFLASDRAAALKKPDRNILLWRERAFDVEIEGHPLSGIFDRVQIELGQDGKPASAHVYDFKTDKGNVDLRDRYKDQLDSYIKAAALLLGMATEKVNADLLGIR
ncbi:MAG: UvrD-helicase domain-containing protein [Chthoniobacterales bacterium]|nr:UvrD-helicase domain-containing protein [Chthoniobacterales bacterium]